MVDRVADRAKAAVVKRPVPKFELETLEPRVVLAADPVTSDHPLWLIPRGSAVIDGDVGDADWAKAFVIERTLATRTDHAATIRMMHNDAGMFLSVEVADQYLWADGLGTPQAGDDYVGFLEQDDSITFYFDPDNSRDRYFQANDRAFGANFADFDVSEEGDGVVRRFKYVRGNGAGGAPNVGAFDDPAPGGFGNFWDRLLPGGTRYAGSYIGTPNDNSDIDTGWSVEVFMSWADIGLASKPVHGQTIGMNFDVIFDQDGGERNLVNNRLGEDRFTLPEFIDDHIQGTFSSYIGAQSGIQGPVNYAKAMFIDARAGQTPATVNDLTANDPTPFSARLEFTAPTGTTSGLGHVSGYAVRYSTSPIAGEATWQDATVYENRIVPRLAGSDEVVRLMGLDPNTTYHVAIRAIDGAGNYGAISNGASFTTGTAVPGDNGTLRVSPNGRFFQFEDGSEFVSVGDHFSIAGAFTRSLYTGTVWDAANGVFRNFSEGTPLEGPSEPFFESLRDAGVNTMRVFLEIPGSHTTGNPSTPNGTYWLEHNAGQFNPAMREFVDNILEVSAEYGFYLIFSPFYTYTFDDAFDTEGPWKTDFGGPLTSIDDFYQNPATLDIAKNRMTEVLGWVNDSPHKNHVMGWEPMNEWEASGWTQNAEGDGFPAREPEMRRRAAFVIELSKHIKEVDPDANVLLASVTRSPRGPVARAMFYDRTADALVPHIYTNANAEPMNSPFADRSVLAAIEQAHYTAYYLTSDEGRRPLLNGEWGVDPIAWEGEPAVFGPNYTEAENDLIFRTVVWSGFASGQFGTALRVPSSEMRAYGFISSPGMRDMQERFGEFVTSTSLDIDWSRFDPMPMAGRISLDAGNKVVHAFGVGDGETGVVYLLQDGNVSTGNVTGTISIAGLRADALFDIEVWATDPNKTGLRSTITGVYSADGTVTFTLPAFSEDIAIKLKARPTAEAAQKAVAVSNNGLLINFFVGADGQPLARVINAATGEQTIQDIASIGGFRGVARDLTAFTTTPTQAFTTREGPVHLAVTDTENNVWLFSGKPLLGEWTATNLTKDINAPGLSGDLTFYLPTWGSLTIAGLDARGHAVAYWYNVGRAEWNHFDYTAAADGPKLSGGLTGFVTSWDALNLVGLSESGEVIAYWWVPGRSWDFLSMTSAVAGPALSGQLTAFTTSWNAMNIVGMNDTGDLVAYWWSPARTGQGWTFTNLSQQVGAGPVAEGAAAVASPDSSLNIFGVQGDGTLQHIRWTPATRWQLVDTDPMGTAPDVAFPLAPAAAIQRIVVFGTAADDPDEPVIYSFDPSDALWTTLDPITL